MQANYPLKQQSNSLPTLNTVTLPELYDTVYRPSLTLIEDFLYSGVYLFVGPPKIGKSFFMAQLAYHVATGTKLWNFDVKQMEVLYLSLEDDMPRLQKRFARMFGVDTNANLHLCTNSSSLSRGLEKQLDVFLQEHPGTKLVIIDTLQKIRELSSSNYSYSQDYLIISKLKEIAARHNICLIVVHHTRKMEADDRFEMISGTNDLISLIYDNYKDFSIQKLQAIPRISKPRIFDLLKTPSILLEVIPCFEHKIGRNKLCPCRSGLKYKRCCGK